MGEGLAQVGDKAQRWGLKSVRIPYHYNFYLKAYSNHYKVCCNPLQNHNHSKSTGVKTTLKEISLKFEKQYGGLNLIPGQKLCYRCKKNH